MTPDGYATLLDAAIDNKQRNGDWLRDVADKIPIEALTASGLPPELLGNAEGIVSYIRQLRGGVGNRRCTLVLLGHQRVGKTSLLWRLGHPDTERYVYDESKLTRTNGIAIGEQYAHLFPLCRSLIWVPSAPPQAHCSSTTQLRP